MATEPEELDAEWQRLAREDTFVAKLAVSYEIKVSESEALLISLRNYAKKSLTKESNGN